MFWWNGINFIAAAQSIPSFLNELLFLMGNSKKRRELKSFAAQGNSPTIQFHQINFNLIWFELNVLLFHWWVSGVWILWIQQSERGNQLINQFNSISWNWLNVDCCVAGAGPFFLSFLHSAAINQTFWLNCFAELKRKRRKGSQPALFRSSISLFFISSIIEEIEKKRRDCWLPPLALLHQFRSIN